jgi:hypothetical protein
MATAALVLPSCFSFPSDLNAGDDADQAVLIWFPAKRSLLHFHNVLLGFKSVAKRHEEARIHGASERKSEAYTAVR